MKTLIKKSLLVLMVVFITVFTLGVTSKVKAAEEWQLVTDVASLNAGDEVIIVSATTGVALSTTQNGNNRGQTDVIKSDNTIATINDTVQVFTLEAGTVDSTFAFNTGKGYIYAASSKSNYLRTETTKSDNSSWTITITEEGIATVKAQGTNTRNWLRYNSVNSLFACYASGQLDISIYKKVTVVSSNPNIIISSVGSVAVGNTLTISTDLENIDGTSLLTWESSDTSVATIENGVLTAHKMGTTTIKASYEETVSNEIVVKVYPTENSELTISEALQVCELTGSETSPFTYSTTGVVQTIETVYDETNDRISVKITDGTNTILAYRMTGGKDLVVGDKITVNGTLVNYQGLTCEFVAGCTYSVVLKAEDNTVLQTIKDSLNKIESFMSLAYKYTHSQEEKEESNDEVTLVGSTITFNDTSKRTSFSTTQQVWEENGVIVTNNKGESSTNIADYADPVRFYKSSELVIKNGGSFVKVEITCNTTSYATALSNSTISAGTVSVTEKVVTIVFTEAVESITITMGAQVRVDSLTVYIEEVSEGDSNDNESSITFVDVFTNDDFRFKCGVSLDLSKIEGVDSWGIKVSSPTSGKEDKYYTSTDFYGFDEECNYVVIGLGTALQNPTRLSMEFTVQAFVVVDGVTYESTFTKTYSVASMIDYYYNKLNITEVEGLCNILVGKGLIKTTE